FRAPGSLPSRRGPAAGPARRRAAARPGAPDGPGPQSSEPDRRPDLDHGPATRFGPAFGLPPGPPGKRAPGRSGVRPGPAYGRLQMAWRPPANSGNPSRRLFRPWRGRPPTTPFRYQRPGQTSERGEPRGPG